MIRFLIDDPQYGYLACQSPTLPRAGDLVNLGAGRVWRVHAVTHFPRPKAEQGQLPILTVTRAQ